MATSLNISDGRKEFHINGDPNRAIWINTADAGIITRAKKEVEKLETVQAEIEQAEITPDDDAYIELLEKSEKILKEAMNKIFASDIADTVFGLLSPLAAVREDGTTYFEAFLESIIPIVERDCEAVQKASKQRMSKHLNKYAQKRDGA